MGPTDKGNIGTGLIVHEFPKNGSLFGHALAVKDCRPLELIFPDSQEDIFCNSAAIDRVA